MNTVKFTAIGDFHYYPGHYCNSISRLEQIKERAILNQADFAVHLGDLCHGPSKEPDFVWSYADWPMPTYHVLGNHEFDHDDLPEALAGYGLTNSYYVFEQQGFRFIVLDTNHIVEDGKITHYANGNVYTHYDRPGTIEWLSAPQIEWMEQRIMESNHPCVLLSHDSLERKGGIRDSSAAQAVIDRVNRREKRVFFCINGHWHQDYLRVMNGVCYFSLNSATFDWLQGRAHDRYPAHITDEFQNTKRTLFWEKPVHAIITLSEDGKIEIDGMNGSYFMNVDREALGFEEKDAEGRLLTPNVLSACVHIPLP